MMLDFFSPLVGWEGAATAAIAGLIALAWFVPFVRKYAIAAALAIGGALFLYRRGFKDADRRKQAQWDAAERKSVQRGKDARSAAERDVADGVRDGFDRDDK